LRARSSQPLCAEFKLGNQPAFHVHPTLTARTYERPERSAVDRLRGNKVLLGSQGRAPAHSCEKDDFPKDN